MSSVPTFNKNAKRNIFFLRTPLLLQPITEMIHWDKVDLDCEYIPKWWPLLLFVILATEVSEKPFTFSHWVTGIYCREKSSSLQNDFYDAPFLKCQGTRHTSFTFMHCTQDLPRFECIWMNCTTWAIEGLHLICLRMNKSREMLVKRRCVKGVKMVTLECDAYPVP